MLLSELPKENLEEIKATITDLVGTLMDSPAVDRKRLLESHSRFDQGLVHGTVRELVAAIDGFVADMDAYLGGLPEPGQTHSVKFENTLRMQTENLRTASFELATLDRTPPDDGLNKEPLTNHHFEVLAADLLAKSILGSELTERLVEKIGSPWIAPPPQKPAPVRVSVQAGKIEILNEKHLNGPIQRNSLDRLRASASRILRIALDTMRAADNIDRRVVPACEPLLRDLEIDFDSFSAESLGLEWEIVSTLVEQFKDAIPDVALIQLRQALETTNVILNQFEEWRAYLAAKGAVAIPEADVEGLVSVATAVAVDLSDRKDLVDPEISLRIQEMTAPVTSGLLASHTILPALVDSLSNIFAALSREMLELGIKLEPTANAATSYPGLRNGIVMIAIGLLHKFVPQIGHLKPFAFMRDAYELANKSFPWMKDLLPK